MSILVIGETDWPTADDICCLSLDQLDRTGLMLSPNGQLRYHEIDGVWHNFDLVLWRAQGGRDAALQHAALSLVAASSAICVNSAESLLRFGTRFLNDGALRKDGLPVIESCKMLGANALSYYYTPRFPAVLKLGNWHMGYGKFKISDLESWNDAVDMAAIIQDIASIEPFIHYSRDLRILLVGNDIFSIERVPKRHQWKANVCPDEVKPVSTPPMLEQMTRRAASVLGMSILGADWIEDEQGRWLLLEVNPAPGLQMGATDCRPLALDLLKKTKGRPT